MNVNYDGLKLQTQTNKHPNSNLGITSTLRKKTIDRSDLFVEPNFDEVKSIAFNSRGERRMLTKEQLESVKLTGEFEVSHYNLFLSFWEDNTYINLTDQNNI